MKSQKQTNKPPRPFKSGSAARSWGNKDAGFIPGQKPAVKLKKPVPVTPPAGPLPSADQTGQE
jgi:hypothetical protein